MLGQWSAACVMAIQCSPQRPPRQDGQSDQQPNAQERVREGFQLGYSSPLASYHEYTTGHNFARDLCRAGVWHNAARGAWGGVDVDVVRGGRAMQKGRL